MTDRIDLDELAAGAAESEEERTPGDWLWGDADPPEGDASSPANGEAASGGSGDESDSPSPSGGPPGGSTADAAADADDGSGRPTPHVPRPNRGKPAGIPVEGGGAGAGRAADASAPEGPGERAAAEEAPADPPAAAEASGPHGGDADEMTLAFTYAAATSLEDPARTFADAAEWADWVGIVGEVDAPVINKFQRDHRVDVDFFSGTGTGPGERLAEIDRRSMFFAERMVVVGLAGRDEPVAERAGWEFVPLEEAAEKAGWDLAG